MTTSKNPETLAIHAGQRMDAGNGAVAVPIYQTTSYQFRDSAHAADLFALKELGHIYSRITNPTTEAFELRMAALEGGAAAMAVSSGQAASALAIQNICRAGDNIVSSTGLYGGSWNLFAHTFQTMGIEVRFVDPAKPEAFRAASDAPSARTAATDGTGIRAFAPASATWANAKRASRSAPAASRCRRCSCAGAFPTSSARTAPRHSWTCATTPSTSTSRARRTWWPVTATTSSPAR